jgi:hypothetical protein
MSKKPAWKENQVGIRAGKTERDGSNVKSWDRQVRC